MPYHPWDFFGEFTMIMPDFLLLGFIFVSETYKHIILIHFYKKKKSQEMEQDFSVILDNHLLLFHNH